MFRKIACILCILSFIIFIACSKNDGNAEKPTEKLASVAEGNVEKEKLKEEYSVETDRQKFVKPVESQEFNFETDNQYYMDSGYVCTESLDNIYYLSSNDRKIYVFNNFG